MGDWHTAKFLWVYGTLRTGESNHEGYLAGRVRRVGETTCPGRLYTVKDCYPVIELLGDQPVMGELFEVLPARRGILFRELDQLEGVQEGYYRPVLLERPEGSWVLYAVGPRLAFYCTAENLISEGDWCRYRRWLTGEDA